LPRDLTRLTSLRSLSLRCNHLQGPLDAIRWGNISQLKHLDLGHNPDLGGRLEGIPVQGAPRVWKFRKGRPALQWSDSDSEEDESLDRLDKKKKKKAKMKTKKQGNKKYKNNKNNLHGVSGGGNDEDSDSESDDDMAVESLAVVEVKLKAVLALEADLLNPDSKVVLKLRRIGSLKNLEFIDLSYCGLTGPFPKSVSYLKKLRLLNFDGNKLTGSLPRLHWPKPGTSSKEDLAGGLRSLTKCTEIGLAENRLQGSATNAVLALPLGIITARLNNNELEERRPKIRNSHFGESLAPAVARISSTLRTLLLHHNDLGRSPAGTGEQGQDSDDDDDSDGEGGVISPRLKQAMHKARQRGILTNEYEDMSGRPLKLTQIESDRAIVRQRYAVHHTRKYIDSYCKSGLIVVELDPPSTDKLILKAVEAYKVQAPQGMLAKLRYDWQQVLEGRADDIPGYVDPTNPNKSAIIPRKKFESRRTHWDI